jgi:hypothetical protein
MMTIEMCQRALKAITEKMTEQYYPALAPCTKRLIVMGLCMPILLAACSDRPALTAVERARFVAELIDERAACSSLRQKILEQAQDDKALNALYEAAKTSFCLKPSV